MDLSIQSDNQALKAAQKYDVHKKLHTHYIAYLFWPCVGMLLMFTILCAWPQAAKKEA